MKQKAYLFFHLNLAFSSIEESDWSLVIKVCYRPILDLIEKTNIPIGIELSAWTLKQIKALDDHWVFRFKNLLQLGKCELIGSGYSQIIAPLVPHQVNEWNLKLALEVYDEILGIRPKIILVNEMAYSNSLVDLYDKFNFEGLIMDGDNIKLAMEEANLDSNELPSFAEGTKNTSLPVLWSDSMLFQKVQQFAHGDICLEDYLKYLQKRVNSNDRIFCIYANDAEVFDYRPGRFNEESLPHPEGEWVRINRLLECVSSAVGIEFISPSKALKINKRQNSKARITSALYPVPVKKQAKYNIARWAVTGRHDLWLNTLCHRLEGYLRRTDIKDPNDWMELCELWASDLRTHITTKKWNKAIKKLRVFLKKYNLNDCLEENVSNSNRKIISRENLNVALPNTTIKIEKEDTILSIRNENVAIELNLRRGLTIENLSFASHGEKPSIGRLPHGHFQNIMLGADYYSGGFIAELPSQRKRVTDLVRIKPSLCITKNGHLEISAEIRTSIGKIIKTISVSSDSEVISMKYNFYDFKVVGSVRLGIITLLNGFSNGSSILCTNGGLNFERFDLKGDFDHAKPASSLVSSSRGLGATTGNLIVQNNQNFINLNWDVEKSAVLPMLQSFSNGNDKLNRILFSLQEFDETVKAPTPLYSFELTVSSKIK